MFSLADVQAMTPELFLLASTCVILLADLFLPQSRRAVTHALSIAALLLTAVLVLRMPSIGGAATRLLAACTCAMG